jgi:hypothetical protein
MEIVPPRTVAIMSHWILAECIRELIVQGTNEGLASSIHEPWLHW